MEILVPEVESYMMKWHVENFCSLAEVSEKRSWKLETWLRHFTKTKCVFSNCLQMTHKFTILFTLESWLEK